MKLQRQPTSAAQLWDADLARQDVALAWLGQAGFLLRHADRRVLIDGYLSDHLAKKYAGQEYPHTRMMSPPLRFEALRGVDLVLCSHRHSDHMDPGALATIATNNPACRFVVPRAELESARKIGLSDAQLIPVTDGDRVAIGDDVQIDVLPSAHETLKTDASGAHHYLGFVVRVGGVCLYHCGDSCVYEGLAQRLERARVDVALLPVNGRRAHLTARGILGNMTFGEARELCRQSRIPALIGHHFGMFDFNTIDPAELRQAIAADPLPPLCIVPSVEESYMLNIG